MSVCPTVGDAEDVQLVEEVPSGFLHCKVSHIFHLSLIYNLWGDTSRLYEYPVPIILTQWCYHPWMILAELILVIIKWLHFNSIIPSVSIGWYSSIRRAYPPFLY